MKDWALAESAFEEKETLGLSLTSLTRTKDPFDGFFDGKETLRATLGAKLVGMIGEGRREADFRESMRDMVGTKHCAFVLLTIWWLGKMFRLGIDQFK